jgi:hypothetical protein
VKKLAIPDVKRSPPRAGFFAERRHESAGDVLSFPDPGIALPLTEIYADTGLIEG